MIKIKFDVITIGGAAQDIMFYSEAGELIKNPHNLTRQNLLGFEYGAKIDIKKSFFSLGGGATNTAVSLARLGFKVGAVLALGDDFNAQAVIQKLKEEKITTKFVKIYPGERTGFSFILTGARDKEHIAFLYRGANNKIRNQALKIKNLRPKWFYITSLSGVGWENILAAAIKGKRSYLAWNPGNRQLKAGQKKLAKFLRATHLLTLNKDEAIELVLSAKKATQAQINNVHFLLKTIYAYGPDMVVITVGIKGAYVYNGHQIYYAPIKKVKRVDTIGVGDAFGSSFLAGLMLFRGNIKKALQLGIYNSASVSTKVGAQDGLLTRAQIKKFNF